MNARPANSCIIPSANTEPGSNAQAILKEASVCIRQKYDIYEMTLQVEDYEEDMSDCNQCQNPDS